MKSVDEKVKTVLQKNSFYFFNSFFEEKHEAYLNSLSQTLLVLKNDIENEGLKTQHFERLLAEKSNGLRALLALTGFSNEYLKRLITLIRVVDDPELATLVSKSKWCKDESLEKITEWTDNKIQRLIVENEYFRKGLVKLFFEGSTVRFLSATIPLFELKKLSISKLKFDIVAMIDTLIRYKEKGPYSARKENNPETVIEDILDELKIPFESGDLGELIKHVPDIKRTMDFIIPNKNNPKIIIESSFLVTTSSGQGDKSKTEIAISSLLKKYYPEAKFVGFVDGIGWFVRRGDLRRMVTAYEYVFTFHRDEVKRFVNLLNEVFRKNDK